MYLMLQRKLSLLNGRKLDLVENTVYCCTQIVSVGICLFAKALFSNDCVYLLIKILRLAADAFLCLLRGHYEVTGLHDAISNLVSNLKEEHRLSDLLER
jgi:hypothetical protein